MIIDQLDYLFICWWRDAPFRYATVAARSSRLAAQIFAEEYYHWLHDDNVVATACVGRHRDHRVVCRPTAIDLARWSDDGGARSRLEQEI